MNHKRSTTQEIRVKYPYLLLSDTHYHAWHQFSHVDADGVNSRLKIIIEETKRAVEALKSAGGTLMVHAGDAFHVRGELAPTVLNPVADLYTWIDDQGVSVFVLAGNHDLEGRESSLVANASTIFCHVAHSATVVASQEGTMMTANLVMIPYDHDLSRLRKTLQDWRDKVTSPDQVDVIIHAPVNGVIKGLPDHGLSPGELADFGFRRVFAGHYHNHKELVLGRVYSIGATTHQTWGDVGSKAGFCLVYEDHVRWFCSHAPEFVDVTDMTDNDDILLAADGNYVRAKIAISAESEVAEFRAALEKAGAKGVVISVERDLTATARTGSTVSAGASIDASIGEFVKNKGYPRQADLVVRCADIFSRAEAV